MPDCAKTECPPTMPRATPYTCADGRPGGAVCKRAPNGICGWQIVYCPVKSP